MLIINKVWLMNNMLKYTKMLLLFVLVLGLTSCDSEEETEYNLPGEWYTSEEIDFGRSEHV